MARRQPTAAEMEMRVQRIARIIAKGGTRSDCLRFAATQWGIKDRSTDELLARARQLIKDEWREIDREQMVADLLSQFSTLQMEARRKGNLNVALGCIHGAAKLAQLVS